LDRTTYCTIFQSIYYLIQEVTTSITFASVSSFFIYQTNGRSTSTDDRTRTQPTNELTNQIKSSKRQNKVFAKPPIGPCLTPQILKMTTTNESKVNLILNQPSDWTQWFFIIKDTAKNNKVWQYIDPSKKKDKLPTLELPKRPIPADVRPMAILITQLEQDQFAIYN
jgi:hypothetical protein